MPIISPSQNPQPPVGTQKLLKVCHLFDSGAPKLHLKQVVMLLHLALNPKVTQRILANDLQMTQTNVSVILQFLGDLGWIDSIGEGTLGNPRVHSLSLAGLRYIRQVHRVLYGDESVPADSTIDDIPQATPIYRGH